MGAPSRSDRENQRGDASVPPMADPTTIPLIGLVLLFAIIGLPGSVVVLAIVALVISIARGSRRRHNDVDPEFSARFRDLENSIIDSDRSFSFRSSQGRTGQ